MYEELLAQNNLASLYHSITALDLTMSMSQDNIKPRRVLFGKWDISSFYLVEPPFYIVIANSFSNVRIKIWMFLFKITKGRHATGNYIPNLMKYGN